MNTDARWQRDLLEALGFESMFTAAQPIQPSAEDTELVKPTLTASTQAISNIRSWRSYLPEVCVASMISDGWQWST
jgi:hypothetical protein